MQHQNKINLIQIITELLNYWFSDADMQERKIFFEKNPGRGIKNYYPDEFNKMIKSFSAALPTNYLSSTIIEEECVSFLSDLVYHEINKDEDIGEALTTLKIRLENLVGEWQIIVPIDNLSLEDIDKIRIGNVSLIPFSILEPKVRMQFFNIIDLQKINIKNKDVNKYHIDELIKSRFRNNMCICIEMIAESNMIYQEALREAENIINLLRIYMSLSSFSKNIKIGLNETWVPPLSLICLRKDEQQIFIPSKAFKFKINFVITKELLNRWVSEFHLRDLERILCKEQSSRSRYETQILRAIRWLGIGIHDDINSDALLKIAIALECLILGKNDRSKSEPLAERCAYLLGDNQEQRFNIYGDVKYFCEIRGKIVHDGLEIVSDNDLDRFLNLTLSCFFKVLDLAMHREIKTTEDFIEWVRSQKFK